MAINTKFEEAQVIPVKEKTYRKKKNYSEYLVAFLFLFPVLVFIGVFTFYPAIYAVYLSLFKSTFLIFNRRFVGIQNYIELLQNRPIYLSMLRSLSFTFWSVLFQFVIGLWLALVLYRKMAFNRFLQALIIIPWTLSPVVVAVMFQLMYIPNRNGILNYLLMSIGILHQPVSWLGTNSAMAMVVFANTWAGMPFTMVMIIAGLQSINRDVYEAAVIDGASKTQQFMYVTMPLLKPVLLITLILITISTFNEFDLVYALTGGGPLDSTKLLGVFMYNEAFKLGHFEEGSAVAVLMFIINLFLSLIYFRVFKTNEAN